jgi:Domain of unknown function (DUF4145)
MGKHWTCPYCNRDCTIGKEDTTVISNNPEIYHISKEYGYCLSTTSIIVCPNPKCRKIKLSQRIAFGQLRCTPELSDNWDLWPESNAKPFPDYIPEALRNDYQEACLIKTKSPKASATLSRRCLQGMIRDFWGVKDKNNLYQEIQSIKDEIDPLTFKAIDAVRNIGNIGAHMGKDVDLMIDVNLMIDVDPGEADMLIGLIETLFKDWYIRKHEREANMESLVEMAQQKKDQISSSNKTASQENSEELPTE